MFMVPTYIFIYINKYIVSYYIYFGWNNNNLFLHFAFGSIELHTLLKELYLKLILFNFITFLYFIQYFFIKFNMQHNIQYF